MHKPQLAIVGHGMVGHYFVQQLVEKGLHQRYQIVVYGAERLPAYDRVHLTSSFSGKTASDLSLVEPDFFASNNIALYSNCTVEAIDVPRRRLRDSEGREQGWEVLVLATGSLPFVPPVPGCDSQGCFVYRTLDDVTAITTYAQQAKRGVVIGGGLLGLEAANALCQLGLETHVVEFAPRLMATQLDDDGAALLRQKISALGVTVHTGKNTKAIEPLEQGGLRLRFSDGERLESDLVLFSAGIRPQDALARAAGLATGAHGGVAIDDGCLSSQPGIYAIGECASWQDTLYGLVAPGYQMARVLAARLAGEAAQFSGADISSKLKLLGVEVASIGDAHGTTTGSQSYRWSNGPQAIYKKIVVSADGRRLLGGVLVGDSSDYALLQQMMINQLPLPEAPETLILPQSSRASAPATGVAALPDAAQICACHSVSKATLCQAVNAGASDLASLKAATLAGTGCGGCVPLVKQVLEYQLAQNGRVVNKEICEHFAWSRQELYHLMCVNQIKTFDQLLARYGHGLGCEICKPLVGSMLASAWNDYLLRPEHLPLQDTNDRYLANIQKDGSYSVVPRIPAGEITPQGLITIGEVALRYGLYTKITGGQRIDLFGASLNQLPAIWADLLAAGFETGHAYGKSLRTVKSCVGSVWCRYGVQDSTALAIMLEHRYKGLRSPHKIKMGVSGCTRECAEAQGKDIGVIASSKGWNLYVGGNGGMQPRHGNLLASDLDQPTLIRTIDRLLMFYIRTADRLQRTSSWLEQLEGGPDYLRAVVLEDKLGIAAELEAEMARVIDSYQCEWRTTLGSADRSALFRSVVNDNLADESLAREWQRGQPCPARELTTTEAELPPPGWHALCPLTAIPPQAGIGARLGNQRIALFRLADQVFALDDNEPGSHACVMSRGILGDVAGEPVVISPLYKQRFRLQDGQSLDDAALRLRSWPAMVADGRVLVAVE